MLNINGGDAVEVFLEREGRQVWATRCASGGPMSALSTRVCRKILELVVSPYTSSFWSAEVLLTGTVHCTKVTCVVSGKETSEK
jgi:hypothetical protein